MATILGTLYNTVLQTDKNKNRKKRTQAVEKSKNKYVAYVNRGASARAHI